MLDLRIYKGGRKRREVLSIVGDEITSTRARGMRVA